MDDYSGHVEPGGPAISRVVSADVGDVEIRKFSVGPMDNNVYVVRAGDQALLVDAANDAERILSEVEGLTIVGIFTTHGHWDHHQALKPVRDSIGAPVWLHPADRSMVQWQADREAADGDTIDVGGVAVQMIHTPGHTPGSTCLLLGDHLITGDTLFPGGLGRSTPETFTAMFDVVESRLFSLPNDTWIYPGHGDDTTIGRERPSLPEWRKRGW